MIYRALYTSSHNHLSRQLGFAQCIIFLLLPLTNIQSAPSGTFEPSEGYSVGQAIETVEGWSASVPNQAIIVTEERASGKQSLRIPAGDNAIEITYDANSEVSKSPVRFLSMSIKPVATDAETAQSVLHAWGSYIGFTLTEGDNIDLVVVAGESYQAFPTAARQTLGGGADRWLHLTIRQDLQTDTWDLYLDDQLIAIDQPLDEHTRTIFAIYGHMKHPTYLDALAMYINNPLFKDSDSDGIPDAWEIAHGLDPYINDRRTDRNSDGMNNIQNYLRSTRSNLIGTPSETNILYVDNVGGNDGNSGKEPFMSRADVSNGPKATLKSAMAVAKDGDTIVILPGTGVYNEGSRDAQGKQLIIKTLGKITIR